MIEQYEHLLMNSVSHISFRWIITLIHFLWQGALIGVIVVIANRIFKESSAQIRYAFNSLALLCLPVCVALTFSFVEIPEDLFANMQFQFTEETIDDSDEKPVTDSTPANVSENPTPLIKQPKVATSPENSEKFLAEIPVINTGSGEDSNLNAYSGMIFLSRISPWISVGYLLGVGYFLLKLLAGLWGGHSLRKHSSPLKDSRIEKLIAEQAKNLKMKMVPTVAWCERVAVPTVLGIIRPIVLLPVPLMTSLSTEDFETIIRHEFVHIRRMDLWMNLFQKVIESLLFFHPVVWYISRQINVEREVSCDELVVSSGSEPINYAGTLLKIAELCSSIRNPEALALSATGEKTTLLEKRIERLITRDHSPRMQLTGSGMAGLFLLFMLLLIMPGFFHVLANAQTSEPEPAAQDNSLPAAEAEPKSNPEQDAKLKPLKKVESSSNTTIIKKPAFQLPDHWIMMDVQFDKGNNEVVTLSREKGSTIRRWDISTQKMISEVKLAGDQDDRTIYPETSMLSEDCRKVVIANKEFVGIWDTATGKLLKKLPVPKVGEEGWERDRVRFLSCTPDLSIIALGMGTHYDRTTLIFDAYSVIWDTEKDATKVLQHKKGTDFISISLSSDGKKLATTNGGQPQIWDTTNGNLLLSLKNNNKGRKHSDPEVSDLYTSHVWDVQFSPDGKQIAVGDILGVRLWDVDSGQLLMIIDSPYRYGRADFVFSHDGKLLARLGTSLKDSKTVPIWSTKTGELLYQLEAKSKVGVFSDDNRNFVVGLDGEKEGLSLWQLEKSPPGQHDHPHDHIHGSRERGKHSHEEDEELKPGKPFAPVAKNQPLKIQISQTDPPVWAKKIGKGNDFWTDFNDPIMLDNNRMMVGTDLINVNNGDLIQKFPIDSENFSPSVRRISANRNYLLIRGSTPFEKYLTGIPSDMIQVFQMESFKEVGKMISIGIFVGHPGINSVSISPDGKFIAAGDRNELHLWEVNSGKKIKSFPSQLRRVNSITFSPDGKWLVISDPNNLYYWKWQTDEEPRKIHVGRTIVSLVFSPDSRYLAEGPDSRKDIKIRDMNTLEIVHSLADENNSSLYINSMSFLNDGQQLIAVNSQMVDETKLKIPHRFLVWDVKSGKVIKKLALPHFLPTSLAVTPNEEYVIVRMENSYYSPVRTGGSVLALWKLTENEQAKSEVDQHNSDSNKNQVTKKQNVKGFSPEDLIKKWNPVWGKEKLGLKYGLALTTPDNHFNTGERVSMAVFFRNVSDQTLHVECSPDSAYGDVPVVKNEFGREIKISKSELLKLVRHYRQDLKPGEAFGPMFLSLGLGKNPDPGVVWLPSINSPGTGKFNLNHSLSFNVTSTETVDSETVETEKIGQLTSGDLQIQITDTDSPKQNSKIEIPYVEGDNYIIFPLKGAQTDLQKTLISTKKGAQVLVNGDAILSKDGKLNSSQILFQKLRKDLKPFAREKEDFLEISIYHKLADNPNGDEMLYWSFQGFGSHVGFQSVKVYSRFQGADFQFQDFIREQMKSYEKLNSSDEGEEPVTGNDLIKVYPVRTALSKSKLNGADCLVVIIPPVTNEFKEVLTPELENAIRKYVFALDLKQKRKILFKVVKAGKGRKIIDRFVEKGSKELAKSLGYQDASVNISYK